jgi:hypothetical protein
MTKHRFAAIGSLHFLAVTILFTELVPPASAPAPAFAPPQQQPPGPGWRPIVALEEDCDYPGSFATCVFEDPTPPTVAEQVKDPRSNKIVYGILFQKITGDMSWAMCGSNPSTGNAQWEFYEAFPVVLLPPPPPGTVATSSPDTFRMFAFPHEMDQGHYGDGKYVRMTKSNMVNLFAAYYGMANQPQTAGENYVTGTSGHLTVNGPGGLQGKFATGPLPNDVNPPGASSASNWANDFGGTAISVARFATQKSICCATTKYVRFIHKP